MTSLERHEKRYQRRKLIRKQKHDAFVNRFIDTDLVFSTPKIVEAANKCKQGTNWKPSVQAYLANIYVNSRESSKQVKSRTWNSKGFYEFDIIERGKPRHIKSVAFSERCLQRSLCDNFLVPILSNYLIYDNSATLPGKGTDFAIKRFVHHLSSFVRKHGRNGFIFFFDFSQYFANINIGKLIELTDKILPDCLNKEMYHKFINVFRDCGLGLGSQVSQISAIFFANNIDHLVKDQFGIHEFARYMDDGYIICDSLKKLKQVIEAMKRMCAKLGIVLNEKKCKIIRLTRNFRFLKLRFFITKTGKIIRRYNTEVSRKERHKLNKFKTFIEAGKFTYNTVRTLYHSWACSQVRAKNFHILLNMTKHYNKVFDTRFTVVSKPKRVHVLTYIARVA